MEFLILGSSPHLWQDKQSEIESALNIIITDIRFGNTRNTICVSYAPVKNNIPDYVLGMRAIMTDKVFPSIRLRYLVLKL